MLKHCEALLRKSLIAALLFIFLNALPCPAAHAQFQISPFTSFSLGPTGASFEDDVLRVAFRLNNTGDQNAVDVEVSSITLIAFSRLTPTGLPVSVGEIDAGDNAVVQASFAPFLIAPAPSQTYLLQVTGTYRPGNQPTRPFSASTSFTLPPSAAQGAQGVSVMSNTAPSLTTSGAPFPPVLLPQGIEEANEAVPPVPTGPFIPVTPTPTGTAPQPDPADPTVEFLANDPLNLVSGPFTGDAAAPSCSGVAGASCVEPSGASNGAGIIFATTNWTADVSTNGGASFTQMNPTTVFPNDAVGYCCDQVVQYVPSIDRFIWVLQGNGYRIASASPAAVKSSGGTAWTYWNLTPGFFGETSLDYPHISLGNNYIYLSFDETSVVGLMVARISLAQLQAGGTITVEWTDPKNGGPAYGGSVTENTGNEVFWAGHNHTSQMRIFSWAEGSGTYFWRDVNIGSWSNTGLSSTTPDGIDFLTKLAGFPDNDVIGATRAPGPPLPGSGELFSDGLWFAWSAGTDKNFKQPHIEMVTLDRSQNFALVQQVQIWNSGYTYVYPALATNACTGEVGFSIEGGGAGNFYENNLVGFWGDFVAYITTNSNIGTTRYGDYVTIRQDPTPDLNGAFFDAFGYGLEKPTAGQSGTQADVRYIQFGRPGACQNVPG
jgi:hypothetical protein